MQRETVMLRSGITLRLSEELVVELESVTRAWRQPAKRDLVAEIEAYLNSHPGASAIEIARGLRARDRDVRTNLRAEPRFQSVPPPPGASPRLKGWRVAPEATQPVPERRTGALATVGDLP